MDPATAQLILGGTRLLMQILAAYKVGEAGRNLIADSIKSGEDLTEDQVNTVLVELQDLNEKIQNS